MEEAKMKIAKMIADYSKSGEVAGVAFAFDIVLLLVKAMDLNGYVRKIDFCKLKDGALADYNYDELLIRVDLDNIRKSTLTMIASEQRMIERSELVDRINLNIVSTIAHELNHAAQLKKCLNKDQDFETKLLEISFEKFLIEQRAFEQWHRLTDLEIELCYKLADLEKRELYYASLPSERMADINSYKMTHDISKMAELIPSIPNAMEYHILDSKLSGYLGSICPTSTIITDQNMIRMPIAYIDESATTVLSEDLLTEYKGPLEDRLYYGLPISKDEYLDLNDQKKILAKKVKNGC